MKRVGLGLMLLCLAWRSMAVDLPPAARQEVTQLLAKLAATQCSFNRNGTWYKGDEARDHLTRKFNYLVDKKLIASAEDFIVQGATGSSVSGQPYQVRCPNQPAQSSAAWLTVRLRELRVKP